MWSILHITEPYDEISINRTQNKELYFQNKEHNKLFFCSLTPAPKFKSSVPLSTSIQCIWKFYQVNPNQDTIQMQYILPCKDSSSFNVSIISIIRNYPLSRVCQGVNKPISPLDFWRKRLFYRYFDINFTFLEYFHVKKVKYNQKSYLFQLLKHFRLWRPFWIFRF